MGVRSVFARCVEQQQQEHEHIVQYPVKRHRGEPGHTQDTQTQTHKTHGPHRRTSQPSKPTNNTQPARQRDDRSRGRQATQQPHPVGKIATNQSQMVANVFGCAPWIHSTGGEVVVFHSNVLFVHSCELTASTKMADLYSLGDEPQRCRVVAYQAVPLVGTAKGEKDDLYITPQKVVVLGLGAEAGAVGGRVCRRGT